MFISDIKGSEKRFDAVLIGAGIMSSSLALLLNELEPQMNILIVERLHGPALESSSAMNNAGTGHAANCELNYTPLLENGSVEIQKALQINSYFEQSLEFWASLTEAGRIIPSDFLRILPHISFVSRDMDIDFLKQRYLQMNLESAFSDMEFSEDPGVIKEWIPMVMNGRDPLQKVAATRMSRGTDIDFGALTRTYMKLLEENSGVKVRYSTEVKTLTKKSNGLWEISLEDQSNTYSVESSFVFIGAGGGALSLLQESKIPEGASYGGFPVSGKWLICEEKELIEKHNAKVYGNALAGAPPMSVPHLDTRWINGKRSLLFGPFAGFNTKFLKHGSRWDLFRSIKPRNLSSMLQVGINNFDLVSYLLSQLQQDQSDRIDSLRSFFPEAKRKDWKLSVAGQRVQIIKRTSKGGILKMGTEVVTSSDGSLAALLGASPGASIAIAIMLEVLNSCWVEKMSTEQWQTKLKKLLPSYGDALNEDRSLSRRVRNRTNTILGFC